MNDKEKLYLVHDKLVGAKEYLWDYFNDWFPLTPTKKFLYRKVCGVKSTLMRDIIWPYRRYEKNMNRMTKNIK